MKEKVLKAVDYIKNTSYFIKLILFAFLFLICMVVTLSVSNVKIGYNVNYGGETIGVVAQKQDYYDSLDLAAQKVAYSKAERFFEDVKLVPTLTMCDYICSKDKMSLAILDNTDLLVKSAVVKVDGEVMAYMQSKEDLQSLLDLQLNRYNKEGAKNIPTFVNNVEVSQVYCRPSLYTVLSKVKEAINGLSVETTATYTEEIVVPYKTLTYINNTKKVGYYYVSSEGVDGLKKNTQELVMLNGSVVNDSQVSSVVVTEPVNKVVTVGTIYSPSSNTPTSAGMIFPLDKSRYYMFATYFWETDSLHAKPHKGLDIATKGGSPIYAVKAGKVITAGWSSSYGYCVKIDHGDGIVTLYAHCSKLNVKVGQTVNRGDTIAFVGSTGYSVCDHLHIEVIVNGSYKNPLNYIGS